ncbi:MAG: hypothetical protein COV47_02560 [Candidatus Diapherotrites archaeon CG11_big_fil_rev_8_21_14_0_20_37_9]|nr:MAG: hypothetical protein COV47_02560 [Candidatus Diapherotrites archaeon CG11_big_fil_rev_8_21_14_0_20_37_9]
MKAIILTPYAEPEKGACVVRVNGTRDYFRSKSLEVEVLAPERGTFRSTRTVARYKGILSMMLKVMKSNADFVIGTSPPITHNFFALLSAKLSGKKFLLDAKDPFTKVVAILEPEKAKTFKFKIYRFMESFTHKFSDAVIFLNQPYLDEAVKDFSFSRENAFLAPNGSDTKRIFFSKSERSKMRKKFGFGDDFVLIYVGGTGDKDLTGFAEKSFPVLAKSNVRVIFITSYTGSRGEEEIISGIKTRLKNNGVLDKTVFLRNIPFTELYKYFSAADAGLVAYPDAAMQILGAKVFDYIAAGLPVCAKAPDANTVQKEFIEKNSIGFQKSDWDSFNKEFLKNFVKFNYPRDRIRKIAENNSREKGCEVVYKKAMQLSGRNSE